MLYADVVLDCVFSYFFSFYSFITCVYVLTCHYFIKKNKNKTPLHIYFSLFQISLFIKTFIPYYLSNREKNSNESLVFSIHGHHFLLPVNHLFIAKFFIKASSLRLKPIKLWAFEVGWRVQSHKLMRASIKDFWTFRIGLALFVWSIFSRIKSSWNFHEINTWFSGEAT
jgi:hypothetical protein